ncbi:MAG: glutaredoxin domain-containing protein [Peptoniphilus rhinitidis]|uniref:glutaredoxin family protein n=1 Tax=Peptoniphilus rhinitidis TaxID=1175452 RepID=UPI0028FE8153|nr:glutaredoxin domain-containing protein [Peptoniphilus rhinitidis]MDU2109529.1 glutaredoxin domain-containing protein [Peptoniphilus lacydonensis]MDU3750184.1 glutaredoxin domain-containing protein [Peptoniphilus rhinitidis]
MKKLYITTQCPFCEKMKELISFSKDEVKIINLALDPEREKHIAYLIQNKIPVVPVLELENGFIVGYNEEKVRKYLNF